MFCHTMLHFVRAYEYMTILHYRSTTSITPLLSSAPPSYSLIRTPPHFKNAATTSLLKFPPSLLPSPIHILLPPVPNAATIYTFPSLLPSSTSPLISSLSRLFQSPLFYSRPDNKSIGKINKKKCIRTSEAGGERRRTAIYTEIFSLHTSEGEDR